MLLFVGSYYTLCLKNWPKYNFCISQGSVATVLR